MRAIWYLRITWGPATEAALQAFRVRSLDVRPGTMSTVIVGDSDLVFDALTASFEAAARLGDIVMVASISNCCPMARRSP